MPARYTTVEIVVKDLRAPTTGEWAVDGAFTAIVLSCIEAAEAAVDDYCGRNFNPGPSMVATVPNLSLIHI